MNINLKSFMILVLGPIKLYFFLDSIINTEIYRQFGECFCGTYSRAYTYHVSNKFAEQIAAGN